MKALRHSICGERGALSQDRLLQLALGYQRTLSANPQDPRALAAISLVALASRQNETAVRMAKLAVTAAPRMVPAWVVLGQALKAAGCAAEAERAYRNALSLDGMDALARLGLGELKLAADSPEEAASEFQFALCRLPLLAAAHLGLGNALAMMCRFEQALASYSKALALGPRLPEAEFASGFVLARLGRIREAEIHYRRALAERPDFAAAWVNLGSVLREQGREAEAWAALRRAVELRPDLISGWINLAALARAAKRPSEAEEYLRKALALDPSQVETHISWCQFRASEGDLPGAWEWLRKALAHQPDQNEAVNMQGILLHKEGRFEEAVECFRRAQSLGSRTAGSNCGNSLLDLGRMEEALEAHQSAVKLDPLSPGVQYNLALTRLRLGDWEHGWPDYEARWQFRAVHRSPRTFAVPRWQGELLEGRRILLHAEQGFGDTIQFCRYAALVAARGGNVVLQVQQPVERLLRSLAAVGSGAARTALLDQPAPPFDLECPLMSLPAVFRTTVDSVPWTGAYLGADPALVREKRMLLEGIGPGPHVGLCWAGNPRYKADRHRSMRLGRLLPLLRIRRVCWISLQKGEAAGQIDDLPAGVHLWDGSSAERDLAETAALIAGLDLVITTDTSIAHLAGAMGKPVWILLPHLSDWRWMQEIETTPWYPTARLFRQSSPGDWEGVLERVLAELARFLRDLTNYYAGTF
jgi:tetratricopeptide (TPR) repeat protein